MDNQKPLTCMYNYLFNLSLSQIWSNISLLWVYLILLYPLMIQRVKVYCLSDDGKWDDRGTGHAAVDYLEVCFI